jgi:putative heme transporter
MPLGRLNGVTLAATAIANSMPAGPVVSSVFAFRQYRRSGADEGLAAWTLVAVFVAASVSLALAASVGVAVAGAEGANSDLVAVTSGVLVVALIIGVVFLQRRALAWVITRWVRLSQAIIRWPKGERLAHINTVIARVTSVRLRPGLAFSAVMWGLWNWLFDCGCLALSFAAVGVGVPWKGLLLAYGAGQLAANLPLTPGGLGVVEGSLTIALVYFGGSNTSTVAAVLLYRILSFWIELPVGWSAWAVFAWGGRRQRLAAAAHPADVVSEAMAR